MVTMAGKSRLAHAAVGASVGGIGVLTLLGILGQSHPEHFDAKQVVVAPAGGDALRVTEVVDIDFGRAQRHGYERKIPNDFGQPTDIVASSPDASGRFGVSQFSRYTRVRIGDPNTTISGPHRYELAYTYPEAQLSTGRLALDIIGTDETLATDRFEVIVTGFELDNAECHVGDYDAVGGCELVDDGEVYRAVFEPLEAGHGITIAGDIVGARPVVEIAAPPLPDTARQSTVPLAIASVVAGGLSGAGVYHWARRRGRNEVYAGGAADAAYGFRPPQPDLDLDELPPPGWPGDAADGRPAGSTPAAPPRASSAPAVRLVDDKDLAKYVTTEFVPPRGIDPWLGRVLLAETYDANTVTLWLSGLAARGVIEVATSGKGGKDVELSFGPNFASAAPDDQASLKRMFGSSGTIELGTYSKAFATEWRAISARQRTYVNAAGLWKRPIPDLANSAIAMIVCIMVLIALVIMIPVGLFVPSLGPFSTVPGAIAIAVLVPAFVAWLSYQRLLPARTAVGSALTLRTASFRRFLAASEARHVEWAWTHGLLREYSAWAVALGTASTWEAALDASSIPAEQRDSLAPLVLSHNAVALHRAHSQVSSSSGGSSSSFGGGGFSGGSVGGGGGGGSSGSW